MPVKSTQKKQQHVLSRREKAKTSPVPWIVLICISVILFFIFGYEKMIESLDNREEIKTLSTNIDEFENEIQKLRTSVTDLEIEFQENAGPIIEQERKIFPESLDTKELVKILELFSLQLIRTAERGYQPVFTLNSLSLSNPSRDDMVNAQKIPVTMSIVTDQKNLETFIEYLYTNDVPQRVIDTYEAGWIPTEEFNAIEGGLPLAVITNLTRTPQGANSDILSVSISLDFYFQ